MRSSAARRVVASFLVFFVVVSISFLIVEILPSTPNYLVRAPFPGGLPDRCGVRATWALDQPAVVRYVVYVANIFRGEWGTSPYGRCEPVVSLVLSHAPDTLILTFGALATSGLLARVIGPALARRHRRAPDSLGAVLALASTALPAAGLGLLLMLSLMVGVAGFVPGGDHSPGYASMGLLVQVADYVGHLAVPLLAVVALSLGFLVLAARNASLREQARRGPQLILQSLSGGPSAPGDRRFAVPPILPEVGLYVGWTMCAALLVEIVFGLDGLGTRLEVSAHGDTFGVDGIFLFLSLVLIATATVIDLVAHRDRIRWVASEPPVPGNERALARTLRDFASRRATLVGLVLLAALVGMTLAAPSIVGPYNAQDGALSEFLPPSPAHPLGTGAGGTDILAAVLAGGTIPLLAAACAFGIALAAGILVALSSGVLGGRIETLVTALTDNLLCLPWLPFMALAGLTAGVAGFLLVGFFSWPIAARRLRYDVIEQLEDRGFPEPVSVAPRGAHEGGPQRLWTRGTGRMLVSLSPVIVSNALMAASLAIPLVAGIAMVVPENLFGLTGSMPGWPSWETMLFTNWVGGGLLNGAWFTVLPFTLSLFAASFAFAVLGFSLREASLPFPLSGPLRRGSETSGSMPSALQQG